MQDHGFYLTLAYAVGGALLALEVLALWRRVRRARRAAQQGEML